MTPPEEDECERALVLGLGDLATHVGLRRLLIEKGVCTPEELHEVSERALASVRPLWRGHWEHAADLRQSMPDDEEALDAYLSRLERFVRTGE